MKVLLKMQMEMFLNDGDSITIIKDLKLKGSTSVIKKRYKSKEYTLNS